MGFLRDYFHDPHWRRQHRWRHAIWRSMARLGLTGLHFLPIHDRWVDVHRRRMPFFGLHHDLVGYRIVQVSDLHFSPVVAKTYLRQMVELINRQKPDLVLVTGDLLTGGHPFIRGIAQLLKQIRAADGVIATFGNHDYTMHGKRKWQVGQALSDKLERHLESHGIVVLRNERVTIRRGAGELVIVGLDDEWTDRLDAELAFDSIDGSKPTLCINHNPVNARELLKWPWQWMLAGHTHGRPLEEMKVRGKIVRRGRPFVGGYYEVEPGRHLYVNRGLSYGDRRWHNNRPEITVFKLARGDERPSHAGTEHVRLETDNATGETAAAS